MARSGDVPRRLSAGAHSALDGIDYFVLDAIHRLLAEQDPSLVFGSLRPVGDEFWNLVDGERSFGEIIEMLVMQFGFDVEPELLLPLADNLLRVGHIEIVPGKDPLAEGSAEAL